MPDQIKCVLDVRKTAEQLGISYDTFAEWEAGISRTHISPAGEDTEFDMLLLKKTMDAR